MKRLLTSILAVMFFLPACGSVLASQVNMTSGAGVSASHHGSRASHAAHGKTVSPKHSKHLVSDVSASKVPRIAGWQELGCCKDHTNSQIGLLERNPMAKEKAIPLAISQFASYRICSDDFEKAKWHPSTAPPIADRQSYAALIGIVRRLD